MKKENELSYKKLKKYCNPEILPFETTEELKRLESQIMALQNKLEEGEKDDE